MAALVILGILAAVALVKFSASNASAVAEAEIFKSYLRYAQLRAMGDISTWGIEVVASNQYTLVTDNPSLKGAITLPGAGSASRVLPEGVTVSNGVTIYFDSRGRPVSNHLAQYSMSGTWPDLCPSDVAITFSGSPPVSVTVTRQTGFIP